MRARDGRGGCSVGTATKGKGDSIRRESEKDRRERGKAFGWGGVRGWGFAQSHEGDVSTCHVVVITCATVAARLVVVTLVCRRGARDGGGRRRRRGSCGAFRSRETEDELPNEDPR